MTKVIKLSDLNLEPKTQKKELKPIKFNKMLRGNLKASDTKISPKNYNTIIHIGYDYEYGDVFKAYQEDDSGSFSIFFGELNDGVI